LKPAYLYRKKKPRMMTKLPKIFGVNTLLHRHFGYTCFVMFKPEISALRRIKINFKKIRTWLSKIHRKHTTAKFMSGVIWYTNELRGLAKFRCLFYQTQTTKESNFPAAIKVVTESGDIVYYSENSLRPERNCG
jgi:hypothetical protein